MQHRLGEGPLRIRVTRPQSRRLIILLHDGTADGIDEVQHRLFAAKIPVQIDVHRPLVTPPIGQITPLKYLRLRQSEFIDALLDIAHQKQVVRPADARHQRLLDQIAVLILVHKYVQEFFTVKGGRLRVVQDGIGVMLYIVKIQQIPPPFFLVIEFAEPHDQLFYHLRIRIGRGHILPYLLQAL